MAKELGWGIIGTGRIADTVAQSVMNSTNGRVVSAVSRDQARAEAFVNKYGGGQATTSYEALLGNPDVNIVYIATPNDQHPEQTIAAAKAGKHVLCEKPLALTAADAKRMVEACKAAGVHMGTSFQTRHHAAHEHAKQIISEGTIGDAILIQVEASAGANRPGGWRLNQEQAGIGALNNIGVHPLDLLRYLLDSEVSEVTAMNDTTPTEWLDLLDLMLMRFQNGTMAYCNANQKINNYQPDIDIYGTKGRILGVSTVRPFMDGELRVKTEAGEQSYQYTSKDAFDRQTAAFNKAILENREPSASGLDGLRNMQLTDAIMRSIREGVLVRPVYD